MEYQASAENNNEEVVHDEFQETVDLEFACDIPQFLDSLQAGEWHQRSWRCQISKVPPELRLRVVQQSKNVYDPVFVALGPYHHGKPELRRAEEFKHLCLNWCSRNVEHLKSAYYNIILQKINLIRECYTEATIVNEYDDGELAKMMLLDACFIINFMENATGFTETNNKSEWSDGLGLAAVFSFIFRDVTLFENQIPFPVLMMLINLRYHDQDYDGEELINRFLRREMMFENKIHREEEDPPIHLLEAYWRVMVEKHNTEPKQQAHNRFQWPELLTRRRKDESTEVEEQLPAHMVCSCRSVMDLKAKGIHVRPSSCSLRHIKLDSGTFYGQLQLPIRHVSDQTLVILSNMIAYEVSSNGQTNPAVLSYVLFMKSLVQSTADVKELQEKGILINRLANRDRVVKMFREDIDNFGIIDVDIFKQVRWKMEKHCRNKAKTWIADLIHTRFNSPWTAIALFAATLLLCLTILQTYFTIRPVK